jgi:hypothetical protein
MLHCDLYKGKKEFLNFTTSLRETRDNVHFIHFLFMVYFNTLPKGYHLDVVGGPSTPHDPKSDAGGSLSSWQGHPSR